MILLVVLSTFFAIQEVAANIAVLEATDGSNTVYPCILYNQLYHDIPEYSRHKASPTYGLLDHSNNEGCDDVYDTEMSGKAVAVKRGNCSFVQKATVISQNNGTVALIVSQPPITIPGANATYDYNEINITVAMISVKSFSHIQELKTPRYVKLYKPPSFDPSAIVLLFIAVATILFGSLWSGLDVKMHRIESPNDEDNANSNHESSKRGGKMPPLTLPMLACIVVFITAFILMLYFLYDYLVYVVIALFCVLGSVSIYNCLLPLWSRLPPHYKLTVCKMEIVVKDLFLLAACFSVGIFWAVQRNESYAWILQDIMGVAFCLHTMKRVQLNSFKSCTILLICLFIYDVFFVFITPYITKSGKSIMVEVATGGSGSSREKIPLLISIPKILYCHSAMSMLGFGDIVIPGLTVAFCYRFDRTISNKLLRPVYFFTSLTAYTVGLLITGVALFLMQKGQPALLYIVPCVLGVTAVTAACRHQLRQLWSGVVDISRPSAAENAGRENTNQSNSVNKDSDTSDTEETDHLIGQGHTEQV